jgi:hypothetical protein
VALKSAGADEWRNPWGSWLTENEAIAPRNGGDQAYQRGPEIVHFFHLQQPGTYIIAARVEHFVPPFSFTESAVSELETHLAAPRYFDSPRSQLFSFLAVP